ncbi:MAG: hypothetical protein E6Q38_00875 [Crocinitomicaceae bacterium]|nr:MAG: hypothetical protein E6Q38_00875 [Crocinitomicaceae bacterium]
MKQIVIIVTILLMMLSAAVAQPVSKPYSNPLLIYGSSFGNFFKVLYKTGDFNTMMKFTSTETIKKFGYANVLEYYKTTDFGYEMKLRSRTITNGVYTLNYVANILSTQKVVRLDVVVENDTAKVVLDNIVFNLGIDYKSVIGLDTIVFDVYGKRMK